jgi:hypothetical protein
MQTSSEPRLEDIRRIAFVTRRFHDLQGLRTVADAVPPLIFAALLRSAQSHRNVIILICVLAAYFVARATWIRSGIDAYYSRRLGRVDRSGSDLDGTLLFSQPRPLGWTDRSGPDANDIFLRTFLSYFCVLNAASMRPDAPLPGFVQIGFIMLMLLMLGLPPVLILIRDWPYRVHWVLPLGVGVAVALRLGAIETSQELLACVVLAYVGCGVALAIVGALDHLLLVNSLGGGAAAASRAEHADTI